jgi:hypothetical protein
LNLRPPGCEPPRLSLLVPQRSAEMHAASQIENACSRRLIVDPGRGDGRDLRSRGGDQAAGGGAGALCEVIGFPEGAVQVVAGARVCMHDNVVDVERERFFAAALTLERERSVQACVVLEDTDRGRATHAMTPEEDVVRLFLEQADNHVS